MQTSGGHGRYAGQRKKVIPPYISLGDFRVALGLTIDEVLHLLEKKANMPRVQRGTISGIENGHRGASDELLRALEVAYDLDAGALTTAYRPRASKVSAA